MASVLTAASVEKLKPDLSRRLELPDAILPGLYLVIQPSGVKSWAVRYRHGGKPRKMTLGAYPGLDLAKARDRGRSALHLVAIGRDPGAEKVEARKKPATDRQPDVELVSGAIDSFIARHIKPKTSRRTAEEAERTFKLHVRPYWSSRRIDDIRRRDVVRLLDRIIDNGHPAAANRALAVLSKFFSWCVERSILDASPCIGVRRPAESVSRDRVLTDDELRRVWLASARIGLFGHFVRLLITTAQRRDEVAKMVRPELDLTAGLWTIAAARTKNGYPQPVPLSIMSTAVLTAMPAIGSKAEYIFTSDGERALGGYSDGKEKLDREILTLAREEAAERGDDPKDVAIAPWRLHDLRRTAATGMARLGTPIHVVEAVLNHTSGTISGVAAIYNRHRYLDEKRVALEAWGKHLACIVGSARE